MASGGRTGNPWYLFWIVFLLGMDLYYSALPTPTVKDSNKVDVCPNNETEWQKASKRLNCTDIASNTKNRYHCLPVRNLTTLMEFCYNKTRPLVTSGGCMTYVPESNAMYKLNCSTFGYGCPDIHYFSDEIYAFPKCSNINPITRCYVADSFCPLTPAIEGKTTASEFLSIISVLYVLIILFVAGIVGLILYKNRKGKKEDGKTKDGEKKHKKIEISHRRGIMVGCAHAGKTTLLRRLENIQFAKLKNEVKSTEMADIYVNMFEVSEDKEKIE